MLNNLVDKALKKKWFPADIDKYIGTYLETWLLYSQNKDIRQKAASGGTITGLLIYLLERGEIDGALVCRTQVENNEVRGEYIIARNKQELLSAQGSKYIDTDFAHDAVPLIKNFEGRLALILLPCDTSLVTKLCQRNPQLEEKIKIKITIFCGHVSDPELTQLVIQKLKPAGKSLTEYRYRVGHWRGNLEAKFEDNSVDNKPFSTFSDYQNLYFYCTRKCLNCHDQTGYESDLSIGDVWLMKMKNNPIKHNVAIVRTKRAQHIIYNAIKDNVLWGTPVPIDFVCDSQSRSLPLHYNVTARARAGKLLGIKLSDQVNERVRIIDFIVAFIIVANYRFSNSMSGQKIIPRIPKFVLKSYLYFLKALEIL